LDKKFLACLNSLFKLFSFKSFIVDGLFVFLIMETNQDTDKKLPLPSHPEDSFLDLKNEFAKIYHECGIDNFADGTLLFLFFSIIYFIFFSLSQKSFSYLFD